ncbi:enoyl-CoA hydratase-related protein [Chromobacterium vaccinii]|uniref:enoyl-CoA hydratase-related protein n=1 Tax=Chromobacterium vaccinii TaxID=1108595 RepID=UPI003C76EA4D
MVFETLLLESGGGVMRAVINRPKSKNAINQTLLREINQALDLAESQPDCRMLVLEGADGIFCSGMDFHEMDALADRIDINLMRASTEKYMRTLKRFATSPCVVVSRVSGAVTAGGVGLVAASDLVLATPESQFTLTEAMWGLLPSNVIPYLIRRAGFQAAFRMSLTTDTLSAAEAHRLQLVDYLGDDLDQLERRLRIKLNRVKKEAVGNLKSYFRSMWMIDEEMEQLAVEETSRLAAMPSVIASVRNFVQKQAFPWESN